MQRPQRALGIVHKTGIMSNSGGQGRNLFIKSYISRSVLSDYAQGCCLKSLQSYEEHTNNPPVARVRSGRLQIRRSAPLRGGRRSDSLSDWVMRGNYAGYDFPPSPSGFAELLKPLCFKLCYQQRDDTVSYLPYGGCWANFWCHSATVTAYVL